MLNAKSVFLVTVLLVVMSPMLRWKTFVLKLQISYWGKHVVVGRSKDSLMLAAAITLSSNPLHASPVETFLSSPFSDKIEREATLTVESEEPQPK